MGRAPASGIRLSDEDATIVKGMLARGDRQHDIAAWFGVNGGRIANVATGKTYANVPIAAPERLPHPVLICRGEMPTQQSTRLKKPHRPSMLL